MGHYSLRNSGHAKDPYCGIQKKYHRNIFVNKFNPLFLLVFCACVFSCTVVKTQHHITLDHNITIKIEKEVNSFLDDLYDDEPTN